MFCFRIIDIISMEIHALIMFEMFYVRIVCGSVRVVAVDILRVANNDFVFN